MPQTIHIDPIVSPQDDERDILFGVINRFIGYFTLDSQRHCQNDPECEYPFVAMDTRQVYEQIKFVRELLAESRTLERVPTFLDIGCGIGNVLLFAELMDFAVSGLEKDPYPCSIATRLLGPEQIAQQDIWEYDDYHTFDCIYYFRPFHDGAMERRFERFIEDQLRPGGVLIANRKMSLDIESDPRFNRLHPTMPIWQKI
jgi:SAM-dependent methyltransferase